MCGIVGFVGREAAAPHLLTGLTILENRGYDSAGISSISPGGALVTTKFASIGSTSDAIEQLREVKDAHEAHPTGIAHTRWATHGGKTDANAHPHHDQKDRIALVHNGVIENSLKLREELQATGIKFRSETDTEVIAQLIGVFLDQGLDLMSAIKKTLNRLEGTWGLAIISKDAPDQIIAARNGSPIVIGVGKGNMFIASEPAAFSQQTKEFIALENDEIAIIKADGHSLDLARIEQAPDEKIELSPAPYPHWTIKEISEQPEAISRSLNYGGRIFDEANVKLGGLEEQRENLLNIKHLIIAACGTSFFAALYGAQLMRSLRAFETVQVIDAAEMNRDIFPKENGGLLVISQSGETKDVHRAVANAQKSGIPVFSIINAVGSLIPRTTRCGVYLNAGREHAVASTKAFTTQVTVLSLVANWFAQNRNLENQARRNLIESLHRLPTSVGMSLHVEEQCREIAGNLIDAEHCFVLGKGYAEPIAREGALKIKEITYLHAEGYPGGALKHGPFALIEEGTPIIMTILDDNHAHFMRTAAEEVRARGAYTIVITNKKELADGIANAVIEIPTNGPLTALLAVVPMQLIAYELAVLRGHNPDKPRNLAKAVTVD
ncbi:MAG: glutamine--fructose-6-phosphate transaminase (isomerizing) [Patescibacteria group bacterium]|nr:glutamine--fructose-6-phosphate transaminase (isomerizing) [Patescibacteria group bacterium]